MTILDRLSAVEDSIAEACRRSGRDRSEVTLVAVSKTQPAIAVSEAVAAGVKHLGENRVQETAGKKDGVHGSPSWHLIGHLQSNKTRKAAEIFDWVESVDSEKIARRLSDHAGEIGRRIDVMIQINLGDEQQKDGVAPHQMSELAESIMAMPGLRLGGLMTIPPQGSPDESRRWFASLRKLGEELVEVTGAEASQLSMGMSEDFEAAIEEGSTMVRIGRAIFGERR